jgi:hypothetical protein
MGTDLCIFLNKENHLRDKTRNCLYYYFENKLGKLNDKVNSLKQS